jgi:hypothetical protein
MPATSSVMGLHLRLRLWIAEMNSDINVLRIFSDYLAELDAKKSIAEIKKETDRFKQQFVILRKEIDDLRHEMQLYKMSLAATTRGSKTPIHKTPASFNQFTLQKRYTAYKKTFNKIRKELELFEAKWSD